MAHMKTITLRSLATEQQAKGFVVQERKAGKSGVFTKRKSEPLRSLVPNSVFALGRLG
jgi:Rrf2 family iron-sulfur cluster assembly transcriptional regulator